MWFFFRYIDKSFATHLLALYLCFSRVRYYLWRGLAIDSIAPTLNFFDERLILVRMCSCLLRSVNKIVENDLELFLRDSSVLRDKI